MKLIADSGSTKTEWILLDKKTKIFNTIGLNPVFVNAEDVAKTIQNSDIFNFKDKISEVHFFGAGCGSLERNKIIYSGLSAIFRNANISVENDLLGAGIAMFKNSEGIIAILGTGSNTGVYKNKTIIENINSLGYILGDEGSGAVIGKSFLKAFLNKELPKNIEDNFNKTFNIGINEIIQKVYKEPFPNRFLASFMPFIHANKSDDFVQNLLCDCFTDFFEKTIIKYENYQNYKIKIIGSVAHFFSDEIKIAAKKLNIEITDIAKSPSDGLIYFYAENKN